MDRSTLIMPQRRGGGARKGPLKQGFHAWAMLGWVGLSLLIVGGADSVLLWYPLHLGDEAWEAEVLARSFDELPVLVVGLGLLVTSAALTGRRWMAALAAAGALALLTGVVVGATFRLAAVSAELGVATPEALLALRDVIAATAVQVVTFVAILGFLLWRALGAARGRLE